MQDGSGFEQQKSEDNRRRSLATLKGVKSKINIFENVINSSSQAPPEAKSWKSWRGKSKHGRHVYAENEEQEAPPAKRRSPVVPRIRLEEITSSNNQSPSLLRGDSPHLTPKQSFGRFLGRVLPGKSARHSARTHGSPDISAADLWPDLETDAPLPPLRKLTPSKNVAPDLETDAPLPPSLRKLTPPKIVAADKAGSAGFALPRPGDGNLPDGTLEDTMKLDDLPKTAHEGTPSASLGLGGASDEACVASTRDGSCKPVIGPKNWAEPSCPPSSPQIPSLLKSPLVTNLAAEAVAITSRQKANAFASPVAGGGALSSRQKPQVFGAPGTVAAEDVAIPSRQKAKLSAAPGSLAAEGAAILAGQRPQASGSHGSLAAEGPAVYPTQSAQEVAGSGSRAPEAAAIPLQKAQAVAGSPGLGLSALAASSMRSPALETPPTTPPVSSIKSLSTPTQLPSSGGTLALSVPAQLPAPGATPSSAAPQLSTPKATSLSVLAQLPTPGATPSSAAPQLSTPKAPSLAVLAQLPTPGATPSSAAPQLSTPGAPSLAVLAQLPTPGATPSSAAPQLSTPGAPSQSVLAQLPAPGATPSSAAPQLSTPGATSLSVPAQLPAPGATPSSAAPQLSTPGATCLSVPADLPTPGVMPTPAVPQLPSLGATPSLGSPQLPTPGATLSSAAPQLPSPGPTASATPSAVPAAVLGASAGPAGPRAQTPMAPAGPPQASPTPAQPRSAAPTLPAQTPAAATPPAATPQARGADAPLPPPLSLSAGKSGVAAATSPASVQACTAPAAASPSVSAWAAGPRGASATPPSAASAPSPMSLGAGAVPPPSPLAPVTVLPPSPLVPGSVPASSPLAPTTVPTPPPPAQERHSVSLAASGQPRVAAGAASPSVSGSPPASVPSVSAPGAEPRWAAATPPSGSFGPAQSRLATVTFATSPASSFESPFSTASTMSLPASAKRPLPSCETPAPPRSPGSPRSPRAWLMALGSPPGSQGPDSLEGLSLPAPIPQEAGHPEGSAPLVESQVASSTNLSAPLEPPLAAQAASVPPEGPAPLANGQDGFSLPSPSPFKPPSSHAAPAKITAPLVETQEGMPPPSSNPPELQPSVQVARDPTGPAPLAKNQKGLPPPLSSPQEPEPNVPKGLAPLVQSQAGYPVPSSVPLEPPSSAHAALKAVGGAVSGEGTATPMGGREHAASGDGRGRLLTPHAALADTEAGRRGSGVENHAQPGHEGADGGVSETPTRSDSPTRKVRSRRSPAGEPSVSPARFSLASHPVELSLASLGFIDDGEDCPEGTSTGSDPPLAPVTPSAAAAPAKGSEFPISHIPRSTTASVSSGPPVSADCGLPYLAAANTSSGPPGSADTGLPDLTTAIISNASSEEAPSSISVPGVPGTAIPNASVSPCQVPVNRRPLPFGTPASAGGGSAQCGSGAGSGTGSGGAGIPALLGPPSDGALEVAMRAAMPTLKIRTKVPEVHPSPGLSGTSHGSHGGSGLARRRSTPSLNLDFLHSPAGKPDSLTAGTASGGPSQRSEFLRSPGYSASRSRSPIRRSVTRVESVDVVLVPEKPVPTVSAEAGRALGDRTPARTMSAPPRLGSPEQVDPILIEALDELIDSACKTGFGAFDDLGPPTAVASRKAAVAAASPVPLQGLASPHPDIAANRTPVVIPPSPVPLQGLAVPLLQPEGPGHLESDAARTVVCAVIRSVLSDPSLGSSAEFSTGERANSDAPVLPGPLGGAGEPPGGPRFTGLRLTHGSPWGPAADGDGLGGPGIPTAGQDGRSVTSVHTPPAAGVQPWLPPSLLSLGVPQRERPAAQGAERGDPNPPLQHNDHSVLGVVMSTPEHVDPAEGPHPPHVQQEPQGPDAGTQVTAAPAVGSGPPVPLQPFQASIPSLNAPVTPVQARGPASPAPSNTISSLGNTLPLSGAELTSSAPAPPPSACTPAAAGGLLAPGNTSVSTSGTITPFPAKGGGLPAVEGAVGNAAAQNIVMKSPILSPKRVWPRSDDDAGYPVPQRSPQSPQPSPSRPSGPPLRGRNDENTPPGSGGASNEKPRVKLAAVASPQLLPASPLGPSLAPQVVPSLDSPSARAPLLTLPRDAFNCVTPGTTEVPSGPGTPVGWVVPPEVERVVPLETERAVPQEAVRVVLLEQGHVPDEQGRQKITPEGRNKPTQEGRQKTTPESRQKIAPEGRQNIICEGLPERAVSMEREQVLEEHGRQDVLPKSIISEGGTDGTDADVAEGGLPDPSICESPTFDPAFAQDVSAVFESLDRLEPCTVQPPTPGNFYLYA
eukprot:jgi/Botrbrau1/20531/Bobra.145_2s0080.1